METRHDEAFAQIGLNILYYRKAKGYTQQSLAEKISCIKNHLQQIETAKAAPSVSVLLDIAEALEIPVAKLFETR